MTLRVGDAYFQVNGDGVDGMRPPAFLLCALLTVAAAAAGCSDGSGRDAPRDVAAGPSTGSLNLTVDEPSIEVLPVAWEGNLGTWGGACTDGAGCVFQQVEGDTTDLVLERPGTNLTGANLTLTWTAASPATEELGFAIMVMATCDGCESPMEEWVEGASPLTLALADLDLALDADHVIHVYVYNAQGGVDAGVAWAGGTPDQAFAVAGDLTLKGAPSTRIH